MKRRSALEKKIFNGSIVLVINLLTFGLFFLRDIFATRFFGLSNRMDSIYLGILIPTLAASFLFQPLNDLLVPKYQARLLKQRNILHLYMNVLIYVTLVSLCVSFGIFLFRDNLSTLLAYGFSVKNRALVSSYILRSIPIMFVGGLIISTNIFLNSIGQYIFTSLASLIVPVISIFFIKSLGESRGEVSFINGMIVGQMINFISVVIFLIYKCKNNYSYKNFKFKKIGSSEIFQYGSQNLVNLCYYGLSAISASFATHFHDGAASLVVLVNKMIGFFAYLFNNTFSSVLMPYFSNVYLGDKDRFQRENKLFLYLSTFLGLIGITTIYFGSDIISHLIFFSSKVTLAQTGDFNRFLKIAVFQIPFLISMILCFKWLTIYSKFKILSIISAFAIVLDFLLNFLLKPHYGILSILISPYLTLFFMMVATLILILKNRMGITAKDVGYLLVVWTALTLFLLGIVV